MFGGRCRDIERNLNYRDKYDRSSTTIPAMYIVYRLNINAYASKWTSTTTEFLPKDSSEKTMYEKLDDYCTTGGYDS